MNKKVIMFYINSIHDGGAERVILEVASGLCRMGYRSILVTSFVDPTWEYPVPDGVERISIEQKERRGTFLGRNVRRIYSLRQFCKKYEPIVLISFMGEPNIRALIATIGLSTKNIISVRNDPSREYAGLIRAWFAKYLFLLADGCVFQTSEAMRWFPQKIQKQSTIIINPLKNNFFEINRKKEQKNIVSVGRLERQKNHKLLIEAFSKISNKYPYENLLIYGRGSLLNQLQRFIESLGMSRRIELMGTVDDVADVLSKTKLFVLPSDYEGMPNALMEAMAVGVPVIATDCPCGGVRSLIKDGIDGRLVPVGDAEQMAQAMDEMLADREMAERMGRCAKQSAQKYAPKHVLKFWREYIDQVVST